jgi:predicted HTH transcriptional regulator
LFIGITALGNPIHIHVYPDKVLIYNDGRLPEKWTVEDLFASHTSKPYNPLIAGAFFRSGQIEEWGRGIEKITNACKEWGNDSVRVGLNFRVVSEATTTFRAAPRGGRLEQRD